MCVCVCVCVRARAGWLRLHPQVPPRAPQSRPPITVGSRAEPSPPQVRGPWVRSEQKGSGRPACLEHGGVGAPDEQLCDEETAGGFLRSSFQNVEVRAGMPLEGGF